MTQLHLDLETRSTVDLRKTGVYVYAEDESTDVWCACYATGEGPIQLWTPDLPVPFPVLQAVKKNWDILAHNANFERIIWSSILTRRYGWPMPAREQWRCTMAMAYAMSLPGGLDDAAMALGLAEGKDKEGHLLMLQMAKLRRKTGDWWDDDARKQRLYDYCRQDVEVERKLIWKLKPLTSSEQLLWQLDQRINDRGMYVDREFCDAAQAVVSQAIELLNKEIEELTDGAVSATTQTAKIVAWLGEQGVPVDSIDKNAIDDLLLQSVLPVRVRRVLEIRRAGAAASVKKIKALVAGCNEDGRARGLLQFHAASTGRWGGRRFQPQNIKRPTRENVDDAIAAVRTGDLDAVRALGEPLSVVADCLHGMVCAAPGNILFAADFSNIEGRVVAWLAGEEWKLGAFRNFDDGTGADVYVWAYASAFNVRPDKVTKDQRQMGKVMELALGYQGGVAAFQRMAEGYGLEVTDEIADELKVKWRKAHPNVVQYWYALDDAVRDAINRPGPAGLSTVGPVKVMVGKDDGLLYVRLPSGRSLIYISPRIEGDQSVRMGSAITYMGVDSYTRKWARHKAYGGMLFNNVVQATARDIQAEAMRRLEARGYRVVLTVHDEVVCEVSEGFGSVEEFEKLMTIVPVWAAGLPVAASAWRGERYRK